MFKFLKRLFGFGKPELTLPPFAPAQQEDKVIYHVEPVQEPALVWQNNPNVEGSKAFNEGASAPIAEKPKQERTSSTERSTDQLGLPKMPANEGTKPFKKRRPYKKRKPSTMKAQEKKG